MIQILWLEVKLVIWIAKCIHNKLSILGIFFTEGQTWFEQRRFALRNLRDFGFGRRQDELETELEDEIQNLIDLLKNGPKYDFEKVSSLLFISKNPCSF